MLRDVHTLAEVASCQQLELQLAAASAVKPPAALAALPDDLDLPTARELVSSEAFTELARFFLRKAPALLRQAAAAAAPPPGASAGIGESMRAVV